MYLYAMKQLPKLNLIDFDYILPNKRIAFTPCKNRADSKLLIWDKQIIADSQGKPLHHEMVDFHSSRPGHDLRYSLSGDFMKSLGWEPRIALTERISQVVNWTLANPDWLEIKL
jgi:hypothetical protein